MAGRPSGALGAKVQDAYRRSGPRTGVPSTGPGAARSRRAARVRPRVARPALGHRGTRERASAARGAPASTPSGSTRSWRRTRDQPASPIRCVGGPGRGHRAPRKSVPCCRRGGSGRPGVRAQGPWPVRPWPSRRASAPAGWRPRPHRSVASRASVTWFLTHRHHLRADTPQETIDLGLRVLDAERHVVHLYGI